MPAGQVAVVTGGESGIGAACVAELAHRGARVVFTYFSDAEAAARSQAAAGGAAVAIPVQCDVGDEAQVEALFAACEERFGTATLPVNSAGRNMTGVKLVEMPSAWKRVSAPTPPPPSIVSLDIFRRFTSQRHRRAAAAAHPSTYSASPLRRQRSWLCSESSPGLIQRRAA